MRPLILALALLTAAPAARAECWMKPMSGLGGDLGLWEVFTEHGNYTVGPIGNPEDGMSITTIHNGAGDDGRHEFPGLKFQIPACTRLPGAPQFYYDRQGNRVTEEQFHRDNKD